MHPTIDTSLACGEDGASVASPYTVSYTCSGSNRGLVVCTGGPNDTDITGITYGGVSLTKQANGDNAGVNGGQIWTLVNPASGANNLVITVSATINVTVFILSLNNVNQSTMINATASPGANYNNAPSLSITTTVANCMVVDCLNIKSVTASVTPGGSQTSLTNNSTIGSTGQMCSSYQDKATAGAATMSWSWSTSGNNYGQCAVAVAPAAGTTVNSGAPFLAMMGM